MTLLERGAQLAAVAGWLDDAAVGHGRLVYVAGEAGVGKSTFVTAVAAAARDRAVVAVGGCDGSATPAPLGPLRDMARQVPPGTWLAADPAEVPRQEVFAALVDRLRTPDRGRPALLVVEDLHWADEATLDLVRHLARRVHDCHALVLVTYRPEDAQAGGGLRILLGDTASAAGTRRVHLPPLTLAGVVALVAEHGHRTGGAPAADPTHLHEVTGGNPFYVTECLHSGDGALPPTVRDAVLARVARLGAPARRAVEVLSLAGSRVEVDLLDGLLPATGCEPDALDEPLARGLLVVAGSDVAFRHELGRLAVGGEVPVSRRVVIHRALLALLEQRGADPARLAHHAEEAGDHAAVLRHAPEAAARAARLGAHREAVEQYRRAMRHLPGVPETAMPARRRADLWWGLGYELYLTDHIEAAIGAIEEARALWSGVGDDVRVGDAWRCLSRLSWFAGRNAAAELQASRAVGVLEGAADATTELGLAYSNRAQLRMLAGDLAGTRQWGRRTLDLAATLPTGPGRDEVEVHALNNLGTMEVAAGDAAEGIAMLEASLDRARAGDLHEHAARAYCNLASSAVLQRRHDDAERHLREGIEYCTDRDLDSWTRYLEGCRARSALDRGLVEDAGRLAEAVLAHPDLASIGAVEPLVVLGHLRARAGAPGVEEVLERATALASSMEEAQRLSPVIGLRCEWAWLRGDLDAAHAVAAQAWPAVESTDCPWNRGAVARWLPPTTARQVDRVSAPVAAELAGRWVVAADLWDRLGSPFDRGLALARSGDDAALVAAVGVFDGLHAHAAADRARALLRAAGRPAPPVPRRATRAHPDGLTARQAEVRDLLADGLSDAEIAARLVISRRTAEHHVAAVLAKLGVASRRSLPRVGGRHTPDG